MGSIASIVPYLWFETEAIEAAKFYTDIFPNSQLLAVNEYENEGQEIQEAKFDLLGQSFFSINAGPYWKINPSISFMVNFDPLQWEDAESSLRDLWAALSDGGQELMPLQAYGFSPLFGWIQDKFGVSWQLILTDPSGEPRPFIMPAILFGPKEKCHAEEARKLYHDIFEHSKEGLLVHFDQVQSPKNPNMVMFSDIELENLWYILSDSLEDHGFTLNGAISFMIICDTQEQVDHYWDGLSVDPSAEECGWLKDRNGLYWQIVPRRFLDMVQSASKEQKDRVMQTMLASKKFIISDFEEAYGREDDGFIVVSEEVLGSMESIWTMWNDAAHIKNWYFASDDWYVPSAYNDLSAGGRLVISMAAKDGSMSFDFAASYQLIETFRRLTLYLDDNRKVDIHFTELDGRVQIKERFEPDREASTEMQEMGWKNILLQFKQYAEAHHS